MANKVIGLDMHGPVYRYSDKQGITLVETITPAQSAQGEETFYDAARKYNTAKGGRYPAAINAISNQPEVAAVGSQANLLELERDIIFDILAGRDAPCGLELNLSAAKYIADSLSQDHKIIVFSSSMIPTSRSILERTLYESDREVGSEIGDKTKLPFLPIPICNVADFGSKKDPKAWQQAFENFIKPYSGLYLDTLIEDNARKCEAAVKGAQEANVWAAQSKAYHQITPEGPIAVF